MTDADDSTASRRVDPWRFCGKRLRKLISDGIPDEPAYDTIPWTPASKPLAESKVALLSTAGLSMMCDPPSLKDSALGPDAIRLPVSRGQERNFIECVKSRQTTVAPVDDAVRSDLVSHISNIAIRVGREITWDPVKEEIIGDAEASRMLTRAHRDPWTL